MVYFGGFFAKLGYFAGFFLYIIHCKDHRRSDGRGGGHYIFCLVILYIIRRKDQQSCDEQVGGYYMINMTITELYCTFTDFAKIGISGGFSLYNINFCRNAMAGGGGGGL